eukprot:4572090-Prymnesium_polylepis.1
MGAPAARRSTTHTVDAKKGSPRTASASRLTDTRVNPAGSSTSGAAGAADVPAIMMRISAWIAEGRPVAERARQLCGMSARWTPSSHMAGTLSARRAA